MQIQKQKQKKKPIGSIIVDQKNLIITHEICNR